MFINDLFNDKDKTLNEVSNELLGRYKKAAGADASAADKRGDIERGNKRFSGIVKATKKQLAHDVAGHKKSDVNEQTPQYTPKGVPLKQPTAQAPLNVPQGWQATTQPDGSTRISKQGSMSSAEYKQNMADYKAKNWTPEKIADYGQRMASGQGYTDAERQANLQQQQQHFGKYADTGDLKETEPTANQPRTTMSDERKAQLRKDIDSVDYNKEQQPLAAPSPEQKASIRQAVSDYNKEKVKEQGVSEEESEQESQRRRYPNYYKHKDTGTVFRVQSPDGTSRDITPDNTEEWDDYYRQQFPDLNTPNDGGFWNADNTAALAEQGVAEGSGQKPTITYKDYTLQYDYQTEDDDPEGYSTATTYYFDVFKDGNRVGEAEYFDYFGDLTIRINGKTKKFEHQHPLASQVSQLVSSLPDEQKRDLSDPKFESQGVAEGSLEEYGDTKKGQKMLTRVQKRAVDRAIKADDKNRSEPDVSKRDLKTVRKNAATADRAWERMSDKDLAESSHGRNRGYEPGFASPHAPSLGGRRERDEPDAVNNIEISINGRVWKIFAGKGPDRSREFFQQKQAVDAMCKRKTAETGKEWSWGVTGAAATNEGTKCNMTEEGRSCPEHGIMECPGYSRLMGEAFKMPPESVQDKMHRRHQELRKKSGLPDPEHYLKLKKQKEQELTALRAEIEQGRAKGLGEAEERYLEELQRAGYDIITEKKIRQRLDPKCWKGKHKEGTKIKGGVRVNNCVPNK